MKDRSEILKVKEYLGMVIEIKAEDPAATQREVVQQIFRIPGVVDIKYITRRADKIFVLPEKELEKHGLKIGGGP